MFDAFWAVERAELPVIGAVNGIAYGGGTELALACDIVLASERARFAFKEATVGLMPGYGVVRGPDVIGRAWTRWLSFTGDELDAEQASRSGSSSRSSRTNGCSRRRVELAGRIAANPPFAVRVAKSFVNAGAGRARARRLGRGDRAPLLDRRPPAGGARFLERPRLRPSVMRLGVSIPVEERLPAGRLVELAQSAERGGFDTVVVAGEVQGPDAMALLAAVAASTERVTIGSGVVPMATRGATLTAMGFATLASLAPGRVLAGVGVSSPLVVEGWHGRTFEPPVAYVRRFLPELRRALDGERLDSGFRLDARRSSSACRSCSRRCGRG